MGNHSTHDSMEKDIRPVMNDDDDASVRVFTGIG